jgi:hypothetical protein
LEDRLTPAIEHLAASDDGPPELTVSLFDTATTSAGLRAGWDASVVSQKCLYL